MSFENKDEGIICSNTFHFHIMLYPKPIIYYKLWVHLMVENDFTIFSEALKSGCSLNTPNL